eukprot:CAMPEP_0198215688 /NCGR_PEP_ID=MMETSP1445-20131203/51839_1 /TAXON_ID=36898 /ORGANISM="Pyramimonas sp., Strain CCMP2087" /LENGTH=160 /DNA_ID=CAMNT_0043891517 /DNA_START=217 /DNA_END=699 /DNA_ORIENTATION=+
MKHMLKSNAVKEPLWYQAVSRTPPAELPLKASVPPRLVYEEDTLIRGYLRRNPEAAFIPLTMNSTEPHFVRKFAWRQQELMGAGYSREEAYQLSERELESEKIKAHQLVNTDEDLIKSVQDEEEEFVKLAISMQKGRVEEKSEEEAPAHDEDAADEKKKE